MIPKTDHPKKPRSMLVPFEILALLIAIYQIKVGNLTNSIIIIGLVIAFLVSFIIFKKSK